MSQITDDDVLTFALEGCSLSEIAAFAHVSRSVARAWLSRVLGSFQGCAPLRTLSMSYSGEAA